MGTTWEEIVQQYGPAVWRVCWRILAHRADVEECFQETFLAAVKVSRGGDVGSWGAMLHSLATARSIDRLRQRVTRRRVMSDAAGPEDGLSPLDAAPSDEPAPAERAVAGELSERLRQALGRLPIKQARAFCLHALEGWSQQKVAAELAMSENAVAVTIHRARRRLRNMLGEGPATRTPRDKSTRRSHVPPVAARAAVQAGGVS